VASTKAFVTQIVALLLFTIRLGRATDAMSLIRSRELLDDLLHLPGLMDQVLTLDKAVRDIALHFIHARDFLYLGRGINYPIALEGALKLKEISYIHAEGYPSGEMKHGPIALIDDQMPVVVIAPLDRLYGKVESNMQEVAARGGRVIALCTQGDRDISRQAEAVLEIPDCSESIAPLLFSIPLQLLAYHMSVLKGNDVDQPRNLAKSVTVE